MCQPSHKTFVGFAVLLAMLISGCDTTIPTTIPKYGPVMQIGTLEGKLADDLKLLVSIDYFDADTPGPTLIAGSAVSVLDETVMAGVKQSYDDGYPILLNNATEEQIEYLLTYLGEEDYDIILPDEVEPVELYSVDKEADGSHHEFFQIPPDATAYMELDLDSDDVADYSWTEEVSDPESNQLERTDAFLDTVLGQDATRLAGDEAEAVARLSDILRTQEGEYDLGTIASLFKKQMRFNQGKNRYTVDFYILSYHDYTADVDYFLITQDCKFAAAGEYYTTSCTDQVIHKTINPWGCGYGWYMANIETDSWIRGFKDEAESEHVNLLKATPDTTVSTEQLSTEMSWGVSAELGYSQKDGAAGTLSGNWSWSESRSYEIKDVEVLNKCQTDGWNNARWRYEFKKPYLLKRCCPATASEPALLSRSTFKPSNIWIWQADGNVRSANAPLVFRMQSTIAKVNADWWKDDVIFQYWKYDTQSESLSEGEYSLSLPWPPCE